MVRTHRSYLLLMFLKIALVFDLTINMNIYM